MPLPYSGAIWKMRAFRKMEALAEVFGQCYKMPLPQRDSEQKVNLYRQTRTIQNTASVH